MKHEADGLYYLDEEILTRARACEEQASRWYAKFGRGKVPMTLRRIQAMHDEDNRCVAWCMDAMRDSRFITEEEWDRWGYKYASTWCPREECLTLMDLLAARARREGRLA